MLYRDSSRVLWLPQVVDALIVLVALIVATVIGNQTYLPEGLEQFLALRFSVKNGLLILVLLLFWNAMLRLAGVYQTGPSEPFRLLTRRLVTATICAAGCLVVIPLLRLASTFGLRSSLIFWLLATLSCLSWRLVLRLARAFIPVPIIEPRYVLIVGTGSAAERLASDLKTYHPESEVIGFLDFDLRHEISESVRGRVVGSLNDLEGILITKVVDEVLIALPFRSCYNEIQETIRICERVGVQATYPASVFNHSIGRLAAESRNNVPVFSVKHSGHEDLLLVKRLLDVVVSGTALVVLSPVLLLVALAIKLTSDGPILFSQQRFGLNRRLFRMYKFRTMIVNAEAQQSSLESQNEASGPVFKIRYDPRITKVGRFLRRTSLDELPQLVNVFRGDMSLVGPRPLPVRDVSRFGEAWLMRRFSVRPGLTCLWQVNGRSNTNFDQWIALDLKYIDTWSLKLDFLILVKTVPAVLRGTGAA